MRVELHPEARGEIRAAALWYETQRVQLGDDFLTEVSQALNRIADAPLSFPVWPNVTETAVLVRMATVHRFPYLVAFELHAERALVLAVAHAKRLPLYWLTRVHRGAV